MQLLDEEKKIHHYKNGDYKPSSELTDEEIEVISKINDELIKVRNLVDKSICKCRRCVQSDQDMTYNPQDGAWYCVECYEEMRQWTAKKKTGKSILFP